MNKSEMTHHDMVDAADAMLQWLKSQDITDLGDAMFVMIYGIIMINMMMAERCNAPPQSVMGGTAVAANAMNELAEKWALAGVKKGKTK